jgi:hypothetical protein
MENPKCSRCKKECKSNETDINKKSKVYKICKDCREYMRIKNKKSYESNKEKRTEYKKEYYENNKEQLVKKNKEYYENNKKIIAEQKKEYRENNKDKIKEKNKEYYENNKEQLVEKNKEYYKNNKEQLVEKNKEYYENNKEQLVEKKKEYYENNKEKISKRGKDYYENNKEKISKRGKDYYENNKEKISKKGKEYREQNKCDHNKERGKCKICNMFLYLVNKQRWNIHRCLKSSSLNKTKSSIDYLGCDVEYFKDYFKKKMDLWNENNEIEMNWDNIHIDHIKPVSSFNLDDEDEFNKCCNYTNFQPLLAKDNLSKTNKWTDENETYWNENIKDKEFLNIYLVNKSIIHK